LQNWTAQYFFFSLRWALMGGVFSALIALGLLPYLESFFSRLTNIKLLELTDVNHPLLKRMSLEAPGTYHHSLIMASLAQSAAESVGANGLLCRVGAYFHDIGKMVKPEYFVENQGALGNPHDPLPPSMSRLVIQSHVKEGLVLARQHRLDKAIADFIVMHHGTSRIEYFYRRAVERSTGLEEVGEDEYRYPGPKPHSRETAILMMADSVEASVRALENPTHQRIQDQVKKIINAKMEDGQFDEVPLTLSDIHKISDSFVNTLIGVYHSRIKYPEASEASAAEAK
jgi:putative nucleotidyltransferase with HDIG domain